MHILAPLAVIPEYQGMGVGGRLIRTGIEHLRLMGCQTVLFSATPPITPDMGSNPVPETKAIRHLIPSGGAQSLLDDASTHRSAHERDRPHPVRAGPDETGALA